MNNPVCLIASYLVNSIWEVSLIGGAGWVASRLLRRLDSQVEHIVWVLTLVLAVLTPGLPLWRWLFHFLSASAGGGEHLSIVFSATENVDAHVRRAAFLSPVLIEALVVSYALVVLYFATRLGSSLYLTVKLRREVEHVSLQHDKGEAWSRCRRAFSVGDAVMFSSAKISGPVTIGFGRPALLLPTGFSERCKGDDFLAALAHECAHIRRRDFQKNLLYEVGSLVIAFHPVTWMVKSQIAQTREMICDRMAIEELIGPDAYTRSLLRLATMVSSRPRAATSHAIGIFDANILEKRVMMIAKEQPLGLFAKCCLMIPAALLLFVIATAAGSLAVPVAAQTAAQTADQDTPYGKVYKVGNDVSAPKLISSANPEFPESARKEKGKFDGTCLINLIVDSAGVPHDVHIARSLRADFDANAVKAVEQYRFDPARRAGEAVAVALNVEVHFQKY
jgi:TonB family protein